MDGWFTDKSALALREKYNMLANPDQVTREENVGLLLISGEPKRRNGKKHRVGLQNSGTIRRC